ncbi:MAG: right-handed parallel beta-helix repeat-containing protein, partial [Bacteroidia bacterium]
MRNQITKLLMVLVVSMVSSIGALAQTTTTYTVGSSTGADYATVVAAANALSSMTISGPIVFEIEDGTYTGEVDIPASTSSSATNTITFKGQNGDSSKVILRTTSSFGNVLDVDGDYIIFEDLTADISSVGRYAVNLSGDNCIFRNMQLLGYTGGYRFQYMFYNTGDDNLLTNTNMYGTGYYGVYERGGEGNEYSNNIAKKYYYYPFYLYQTVQYEVSNNICDSATNTFNYGIYSYDGEDGIINANHVYNGYYGIYVNRDQDGGGDSTVISNNVVKNSGFTGAYVYAAKNIRLYHNVFEGSTYGLYAYSAAYSWASYLCEDIRAMNNIFISKNNYPVYFYIYNGSGGTVEDSFRVLDYNDYYRAGVTTPDVYIGNRAMAYNAINTNYKSQGANAVSVDPGFSDVYDYETFVVGLNNKGYDVGIDKDINGNDRPNSNDTQVDIGANDFYLPPYDLDIVELTSPMQINLVSNTIAANFQSAGSDTIKNFDAYVEYSVDSGNTWVKDTFNITSMAPGAVQTFTFTKKWIPVRSGNFRISIRITTSVSTDPDLVDRIDVDVCTPLGAGTYVVDTTATA